MVPLLQKPRAHLPSDPAGPVGGRRRRSGTFVWPRQAFRPVVGSRVRCDRRGTCGGPPNVVGLNLVVAEERLRSAGWIPRPFNTDTLFGIVVPSHYTVCHEYRPIGQKVRLLAQKYGC